MSKSTNHPFEELLAAYSAGSLPLSQALCVSAHLEHCESCGQKLARLNRVGSELMQQLKPARASDELKNRMLDSLDSLTVDDIPPQHSVSANPSVPRCLNQFIDRGYDDLPWKRVSADIQSVELCRDSNGAKVELLKIKPGGSATTHTHLGDEYTVILEGSFSDEAGVYREGDFMVRGTGDQHTPVATQDRECICLAVTEGPVQFTGLFSRMLNPLIRRNYV
ncbi:MAG: anti-sigma factor [Gammaproteobacteria bacterium]|jgi:putative transcriptional regulator|nr:anti-sigma factor [Gammaproteobacteria bacterium]